MATKVIKKIANTEYGIEAQIAEIEAGYSVTIFDTDAQEFIGMCKIYPPTDYDKALAFAETIVN